jgi:hypothetical protein
LISSTTLPLALASGLYSWQAVNYCLAGQYGMALAFIAYAVANAGFIIASS